MKYAGLLLTGIVLLNLSGCVTTPPEELPPPAATIPSGLYHRVLKGETLWSIARMNNVDLDELVRLNRLSEVSTIEIGQLLLLPRSQKQAAASAVPSNNEDFIWPLKGAIISPFGHMYDNMINKGINIQATQNADVVAARGGKIIFTSDNFLSFGKTIIIDHGDNFSTVYARNSEILVKLGDVIERGAVIAKVGSAGRDKNPYLHFQIRKGPLPQNPLYYLPR